MNIREILERVARGELSVEEAEKRLRLISIEEVLGVARLDVGRDQRRQVPEIVLAEGKGFEELVEISKTALEKVGRVVVSRVWGEALHKLVEELRSYEVEVFEKAGMLVARKSGYKAEKTGGRVGILSAGTSDVPVAEEAAVVAREMGCEVFVFHDVGVAGLHRLAEPLKKMVEEDVDAIVVVAGREGALASIVASLVDVPVVGVPTSSGYGAGAGGESALLAMLQACPLGLAVVNIDGGVPAGAFAALIANRAARFREKKA